MSFRLHPRLDAGSLEIGRIGGCVVLLKNNSIFPWFLAVPMVEEGIEDLHQLDDRKFHEVMNVVRLVSQFVSYHFQPEKLNVACIGNQVRQIHIHIVGRSTDDPAWPGTVWAFEGKAAYTPDQMEAIQAAWHSFSFV